MAERHTRKQTVAVAAIAFVALTALILWAFFQRNSPSAIPTQDLEKLAKQEIASQVLALENQERQANETVWKKELLAQQCGEIIDNVWNSLNSASNKIAVISSLAFDELVIGNWTITNTLPLGIIQKRSKAEGLRLNPAAWQTLLHSLAKDGWEITATEFRHQKFETDSIGNPKRSEFLSSAHLTNPTQNTRAILEGTIDIEWKLHASNVGAPEIARIDAIDLSIKLHQGDPGFRREYFESIKPPDKSFFIDPLILYDLDNDGASEIILAAKNLVIRRNAQGQYASSPLLSSPIGLIFTGLISDFTGNGTPDFLAAVFDGLILYEGSNGGFPNPGRLVWKATPRLRYAQALTCGDIDRDGDLDVWLGQYKLPYERGQMPTPFYDANDGNPAYLLVNDGKGLFSDRTSQAGLEQKRWRRTYSASFTDLDKDKDLDLLVVSDFSGVDLYQNDGKGNFNNVTGDWIPNRYAAGMGHVITDFNADSQLDLLVIGMSSPTVDRLEHLGLTRPGIGFDTAMRAQLMHGNRLYFGKVQPGFIVPEAAQTIARSGWSWGASGFDLDNDGFPEVYIANGHETKQLVQDYDSQFWLHDIFVANSSENPFAAAYFAAQYGKTRARGYSYGGYDKNRLYLNLRGQEFVEVGHLMGVALEQDARNVVAEDLDNDGQMDLLVTTFEAWPQPRQTLQIYKNALPPKNHWIGVKLFEEGNGISPIGATLTIQFAGKTAVRQILNGDSYRSQHSCSVHFGLGPAEKVQKIEILWSDGRTRVMSEPLINQWHDVRRSD